MVRRFQLKRWRIQPPPREAGIRTETNEFISPTDITETLYCIRECLDGAKIQQTFADALSMLAVTAADRKAVQWAAKKAKPWVARKAAT